MRRGTTRTYRAENLALKLIPNLVLVNGLTIGTVHGGATRHQVSVSLLGQMIEAFRLETGFCR
jgi:hypothetical protein